MANNTQIDSVAVTGGSIPTGDLGFIRNYKGHVDATSNYRIEDPSLEMSVCAPFQQEADQEGGSEFPRLVASPGDTITATYTENGHISKPEAADAVPGDIFWFGTTETMSGDSIPTLKEVMEWTADGSGGNGKGFKMSGATDFDDTRCIEDNGTPIALQRQPAQACQSSFRLPQDIDSEHLTVFWVWDFSAKLGIAAAETHTEWYTSCMDFVMKSDTAATQNVPTTEAPSSNDSVLQAAPGSNENSRRSLVYRSAKFAAALW